MTEDDQTFTELLRSFYLMVGHDPKLLPAFLIALARCADDEPDMPVHEAVVLALGWVMVTDHKRRAKYN